ncbi:MAG: hypothetical protein ACYDG3_14775 [Bacillati bacterium]
MAGKINAATPAQALAARDAVAKLEKELQLYAQGSINTTKANAGQAGQVNALIDAALTALAPLNTGA